jgi:adenylate kinase
LNRSHSAPLRLVLLGPPASGKGTQGRRLAASLDLAYLGTGALLRAEMDRSSPLGQKARPILARGEYLPDELMCPILADWLEQHSGGWVLDGFPRSLPQARFLDEWLAARGLKLDGAVSLEVPISELLSRVLNRVECPQCRWTGQREQLRDGRCPDCGAAATVRADDSEANFRSRHAEFELHTQPAIRYYRESGMLLACDATAPQDEVAARILAFFPPRAASQS